MNMFPLVGFYMKHSEDIKTITKNSSGAALDIMHAMVPVIKKHWPQANKNNMLDDLVNALDNATSGDWPVTHYPGYPDPTQQ